MKYNRCFLFLVDFFFKFNMDTDNRNYQQQTQDNVNGLTLNQRHERILSLLVIAIISLLTGNEILIISKYYFNEFFV